MTGTTRHPSWNPLLELHAQRGASDEGRKEALRTYGFAIPTDAALDRTTAHSPRGVVEIGAGLGYWAKSLHDRGVDVIAYDIEPPPSERNQWYSGREPWHPVAPGGPETVAAHADRTLLMVWPTRNEIWPSDAIELFHQTGGVHLVLVGEPVGGRTGDDRFHTMLGNLDQCYACRYGSTGTPCTCGVRRIWERSEVVELPRWQGCSDRLEIYRRAGDEPAPSGRRMTGLGRRLRGILSTDGSATAR